MTVTKIALSFNEGRVVRDLFLNGLPEKLFDHGYSMDVFTPAASVESFVKQWEKPGLKFYTIKPYFLSDNAHLALKWRNRIIKNAPFLLPLWSNAEKKLSSSPDPDTTDVFLKDRPRLVVVTNPVEHHEQPVFRAAQALGIPTLGIVRSWDNLYKGFRIRPDHLAVWNSINRDEAINKIKYKPQQVHIIGSTQFDAYFDPSGVWTREELASKINLDPKRPIITLATLGPFQHQYDETYLMDWLVNAIQTGLIPKNCQVVCRLHPWSRLEHFMKYQEYEFVRLSWVSEYIPSLAWTMTKENVFFIGNLLRHSDVVISPGSMITIETAIFDTPTLVPIFHTYQPELGKVQFNHHLSTHFKRLKDMDLIPIIENSNDLPSAIQHAFADRSWYREQRKQLVKDYIGFTDGKSTDRLAELIYKLTK